MPSKPYHYALHVVVVVDNTHSLDSYDAADVEESVASNVAAHRVLDTLEVEVVVEMESECLMVMVVLIQSVVHGQDSLNDLLHSVYYVVVDKLLHLHFHLFLIVLSPLQPIFSVDSCPVKQCVMEVVWEQHSKQVLHQLLNHYVVRILVSTVAQFACSDPVVECMSVNLVKHWEVVMDDTLVHSM